jgi:hypothetical protein
MGPMEIGTKNLEKTDGKVVFLLDFSSLSNE